MKIDSNTTIPVYVKTSDDMPWPNDSMFYLLSANGLFLCRNHKWFQSCSETHRGPSELAAQKPFAKLNYPAIPKLLIETAVGFFHKVFKEKDWESALILVWNRNTQAMELVCPEQKAGMASVKYDIPVLPSHLSVIGDLHSHCDFAPHCSMTDEEDEMKRPGLHIVAGYVNKEPPEFYAAAVVDGTRFEVKNPKALFADYTQRNSAAVPEEWMGKIKALYEHSYFGGGGHWVNSGPSGYWSGGRDFLDGTAKELEDADRKLINEMLTKELQYSTPPDANGLSNQLWHATKRATFDYCSRRVEKFLKHWNKAKSHYDKNANRKAA